MTESEVWCFNDNTNLNCIKPLYKARNKMDLMKLTKRAVTSKKHKYFLFMTSPCSAFVLMILLLQNSENVFKSGVTIHEK